MKRTLATQLYGCTSGASLLEAAFMMPVAVLMLIGGVEMARVLTAYHTADNALRSAARYVARIPPADPSTGVPPGWAATIAQNLALKGKTSPSVSDPYLVSSCTSATCTVTVGPSTRQPPAERKHYVEVAGTYTLQFAMLPAIGHGASMTLRMIHEERRINE